MKGTLLQTAPVDELVGRFVELALAQDAAQLRDKISRFNALFDEMTAVENELKSRPGDQRSALLRFLGHENPQVRLRVAQAVMVLAPDAARACLQSIIDTEQNPHVVDAMSHLMAIDAGRYTPS